MSRTKENVEQNWTAEANIDKGTASTFFVKMVPYEI